VISPTPNHSHRKGGLRWIADTARQTGSALWSDEKCEGSELRRTKRLADFYLKDRGSDLKDATLHRRNYFLWQPNWDHDHCEFCATTFLVPGYAPEDSDVEREGWTTDDEYEWVCDQCFRWLRDQFKWKVRGAIPTDRPDTAPPKPSQAWPSSISKTPPDGGDQPAKMRHFQREDNG
jgi:hypothetical protein